VKTSAANRSNYTCAQNGCSQTFYSGGSFYHHLHVCDETSRTKPAVVMTVAQPALPNFDVYPPSPPVDVIGNDLFENCENEAAEFDLTKSFACIMLKLRADFNCSHEAIDFICSEFQKSFLDLIVDSPTILDKVQETILALKNLNTQKKRSLYFKKHLGFKSPLEIPVGQPQQVTRLNGPSGLVTRFKTPTFQYISLRTTLSALFSIQQFRDLYFSETESEDGFVRSHRDSLHFKKHPLFSRVTNALRIMLFFDDAEFTNPLGSKTKKHDQGIFNFIIANMPPSFNSQLSSIFPLAVCNGSLLRETGFDFVLNEIMNDIHALESNSGMLLDVDGFPGFRIRGTIVCLCGDTKGIHEVGGFMSPSADKFCRLCLIRRSQIPEVSDTQSVDFRNRVNYEEGVANANDLGKADSTTGIARPCKLNESRYFHITENLSFDSMHDLLEGVVPFTIKLMLRHFLLKGFINSQVLNTRIRNFQYSLNDLRNKPSPKFTDATLGKEGNYNTKQRAAQNWCLARMLPLLIGDLIERGDPHFSLILTLLEIMDIVFCPAITNSHPAILKHLIIQIFEQLRDLHPNLIPINKWHHLIHYPEILKTLGPAIRFWCMRFEAAHNIAKRRAQANGNFLNLSQSIANHLALVFTSNLLKDDMFDVMRLVIGPRESERARWVSIRGWEYRENTVVLLKKSSETENFLPVFAKITEIRVEDSKVSFSIRLCETLGFDGHFHAFEIAINPENDTQTVKFENLPECEPLTILKSFSNQNTLYICPRHQI
jgi:hypothetical protein